MKYIGNEYIIQVAAREYGNGIATDASIFICKTHSDNTRRFDIKIC